MDSALFEVLGKFAGLAGISVGLVLVVFRQLLKLQIFSTLLSADTYKLLQQLMYLTFGIGVIGIAAWVYVKATVRSPDVAIKPITGRVIDANTHQPIANARVTLSGRSENAPTDGDGNFTLDLLTAPGGPLLASISAPGYQIVDQTAVAGQNLDVKLLPSAPPPPPAGVGGGDPVGAGDLSSIADGGYPVGTTFEHSYTKNDGKLKCTLETVKTSSTEWWERPTPNDPADCLPDAANFRYTERKTDDPQYILLYDESRGLLAHIAKVDVGQSGPSAWRLLSKKSWNETVFLTRTK